MITPETRKKRLEDCKRLGLRYVRCSDDEDWVINDENEDISYKPLTKGERQPIY